MTRNGVVRDIVRTYELPQKLEDKLIVLATSRVTELGLTDYSSIYRYVAHLVDRFKIPYPESHALRLDAPQFPSGKTFHDTLQPQISTSNSHQEYERNGGGITVRETVQLLRGHISDSNFALLLSLSENNGNISMMLNCSPEEILGYAPHIEERLEVLVGAYGRYGDLLSKRPIVSINFYPSFSIRFRDAPKANFDEFRQARYHGFDEKTTT